VAFLTGIILIDAPASALNNAGANELARTENAVATKVIRTRQGAFPYVSAQAFRYWLRTTLERTQPAWKAAPVYREAKVAYTDGNPIRYWDDDLFGYMRAQSKRADAAARGAGEESRAGETPTSTEPPPVSAVRVSPVGSIGPGAPIAGCGLQTPTVGDAARTYAPVLRPTLKGMISLDLHAAGLFSYRNRTGYRNLDDHRLQEARDRGLEPVESEQSFRLPLAERIERVQTLLKGLAMLMGGAKLALHYTDVTPVVFLALVLRGGNNPLQYIIQADAQGLPSVHTDAVEEVFRVWGDQILSPLYVGWTQGFHDAQRTRLLETLERLQPSLGFRTGHPREVMSTIAQDFRSEANAAWLA